MPLKGAAITISYVAWDTSANAGKTGDAANHTLRGVGDGTEFTPAATPVQVDAVNLPGVYKVAIAGGENAYDVVTLGGKSSTAGVSLIPITWVNSTNVPQTGDSFARIGANGASLTALGDARLANLDAPVSSRNSVMPPTAAAIATAVHTTQMAESYNVDGVAPTLAQGIYVCMQRLVDFAINGNLITIRKLDGTTQAFQLTTGQSHTSDSASRTS
jgi:hypothetical protein